MKKIFVLVATAIGSTVGWWLGAHVGTMTAFITSMVGTGFGIFYGARLARKYE